MHAGVVVGLGWQVFVAYINIGCYYLIGLPLGIIMGWVFNTGVEVSNNNSLTKSFILYYD